jgi:hypothetical protein
MTGRGGWLKAGKARPRLRSLKARSSRCCRSRESRVKSRESKVESQESRVERFKGRGVEEQIEIARFTLDRPLEGFALPKITLTLVIPAKLVLRESGGAGIHLRWAPAFAGATEMENLIKSGGPQVRGNYVEGHVIPAQAGIHFLRDMDPRPWAGSGRAFRGARRSLGLSSLWVGLRPMHTRNDSRGFNLQLPTRDFLLSTLDSRLSTSRLLEVLR